MLPNLFNGDEISGECGSEDKFKWSISYKYDLFINQYRNIHLYVKEKMIYKGIISDKFVLFIDLS